MSLTTSKKKRTPKLTEKPEAVRESKRICLPIERELHQQIVMDQEAYRIYLDETIHSYPELFPASIARGYRLYGFSEDSVKMPDVRIRRLCLHERDAHGRVQVFQVAPSFVLPYIPHAGHA